jgi:hypothetical protein
MRAADVVLMLPASKQKEALPSCRRCSFFMLHALFNLVFGGSRLVFGHVDELLEDRTVIELRGERNQGDDDGKPYT